MYIVGSGLLDTCGCGVVRVLVNGTLQLFQELIDVQKVALRPQVGQGKCVRVHRRM